MSTRLLFSGKRLLNIYSFFIPTIMFNFENRKSPLFSEPMSQSTVNYCHKHYQVSRVTLCWSAITIFIFWPAYPSTVTESSRTLITAHGEYQALVNIRAWVWGSTPAPMRFSSFINFQGSISFQKGKPMIHLRHNIISSSLGVLSILRKG